MRMVDPIANKRAPAEATVDVDAAEVGAGVVGAVVVGAVVVGVVAAAVVGVVGAAEVGAVVGAAVHPLTSKLTGVAAYTKSFRAPHTP